MSTVSSSSSSSFSWISPYRLDDDLATSVSHPSFPQSFTRWFRDIPQVLPFAPIVLVLYCEWRSIVSCCYHTDTRPTSTMLSPIIFPLSIFCAIFWSIRQLRWPSCLVTRTYAREAFCFEFWSYLRLVPEISLSIGQEIIMIMKNMTCYKSWR